MKRDRGRRKSAKRTRGGAGRKAAARKGRGAKPILEESALVKATAKAAASIKTSLREEPAMLAEAVLKEAEQIGMLLADQDEEEDPEPHEEEEDETYLRERQAASRPRSRPSPTIVRKPAEGSGRRGTAVRRDAGSSEASAASVTEPGATHLFPRNLKVRYPVAVRAHGIWIEDSAGRKYLDGCGGAVVCSIGHGVPEIAEVMTSQARRLAFAHSSQFVTRETMGLAGRIAALSPGR